MSGAETLKLVELNPLRTCLVMFMAGMQGTLGQRGICKNRNDPGVFKRLQVMP